MSATPSPDEPAASASEPAQLAPELPALPDDALMIVAVRDTVLFPGTVFPVAIGREASVLATQQALRQGARSAS
jgi:ATP-dependent Lon protease